MRKVHGSQKIFFCELSFLMTISYAIISNLFVMLLLCFESFCMTILLCEGESRLPPPPHPPINSIHRGITGKRISTKALEFRIWIRCTSKAKYLKDVSRKHLGNKKRIKYCCLHLLYIELY